VETLALDFALGSDGIMTGQLKSSTSSAAFRAVRALWRTGAPASPYQGIHIAALPLDAQLVGDTRYPQGTGYFGGYIGANGVWTAAARFADNILSTIAVTIGADQSIPLHWQLYNNTGSMHGWASSDGSALTGDLTWSKRAQTATTLSYKAGFPAHPLHVQGGRMRSYAANELPLGWPVATGNATAALTFIGASDSLTQPFTITASSALLPVGSPLSLLIQRDQNKFTGTVKVAGRVGQFFGVFIDQIGIGIGHVQIPATTARGAPVLSGQIIITSTSID
jgi:hypothetical protein